MSKIIYVGVVFLFPQLASPSACVYKCQQGVFLWVYQVSFGVMYSQDLEELEDDPYQEDEEDSEGSEVNSELEFHLYSQLHYSSNAGEVEEQVEGGEEAERQGSQQLQRTEKSADDDGEQEQTSESGPPSPNMSTLKQHLKKQNDKSDKGKKVKSSPAGQKSSFVFEEVIVIDSSPDVISISDDDTSSDDEGVCALKGQGSQQLQTSTPAHQVDSKNAEFDCLCRKKVHSSKPVCLSVHSAHIVSITEAKWQTTRPRLTIWLLSNHSMIQLELMEVNKLLYTAV